MLSTNALWRYKIAAAHTTLDDGFSAATALLSVLEAVIVLPVSVLFDRYLNCGLEKTA